jgi:hypothetical protein
MQLTWTSITADCAAGRALLNRRGRWRQERLAFLDYVDGNGFHSRVFVVLCIEHDAGGNHETFSG